jgi:hypothetical protein
VRLLTPCRSYSHDIISCGKNYNRVRRAICSGFFRNAAKKDPQEGYKCLAEGGGNVYIHPSSSLFNRPPEMVIYHEVVLTTRCVCGVAGNPLTRADTVFLQRVHARGLRHRAKVARRGRSKSKSSSKRCRTSCSRSAPQYFRTADSTQISKRKRQEKVQPLFDKYAEDQGASSALAARRLHPLTTLLSLQMRGVCRASSEPAARRRPSASRAGPLLSVPFAVLAMLHLYY